jgi:hypothetical protein
MTCIIQSTMLSGKQLFQPSNNRSMLLRLILLLSLQIHSKKLDPLSELLNFFQSSRTLKQELELKKNCQENIKMSWSAINKSLTKWNNSSKITNTIHQFQKICHQILEVLLGPDQLSQELRLPSINLRQELKSYTSMKRVCSQL